MLKNILSGAFIILCLACADEKETAVELRGAELEGDYKRWNSSFSEDIDLSSEFVPLNTSGERISREEFLQELRSGDFIPVKTEKERTYALYELSPEADDRISARIREAADRVYEAYQSRNDSLPGLEYADTIEGFEEYAEKRKSLPPPPSSPQPTGRSGATTTLADSLP